MAFSTQGQALHHHFSKTNYISSSSLGLRGFKRKKQNKTKNLSYVKAKVKGELGEDTLYPESLEYKEL